MLSKPLAALSAGKQQLEIELGRQAVEREQIANRVAVLGPRQAPEGRHFAGLRRRRGGGVELRFEESGGAPVLLVLGPRPVGRHLLAAELADDLLPVLRVGGNRFDARRAR